MTIQAIILFALAAIIIIGCISSAIITRTPQILSLLPFPFISFIAGLTIQHSIPHDDDVKNGKAHYVEQNHVEIVNGTQ